MSEFRSALLKGSEADDGVVRVLHVRQSDDMKVQRSNNE